VSKRHSLREVFSHYAIRKEHEGQTKSRVDDGESGNLLEDGIVNLQAK
jgi:hypothetical protein